MTLYDCGMALLHPQAANYFLNGRRPAGTGNPHPNLVPYDKFPTKTCDIFIACGNNGQFRKLAEIIGRPELADDPRFAGQRQAQRQPRGADRGSGGAFAEHDGNELSLRLIRDGVPAGPVLPVDEATAAPHTAHREMVTELDWYRGLGTPIKLGRTPGGTRRAPPNSRRMEPRCWRSTATPENRSFTSGRHRLDRAPQIAVAPAADRGIARPYRLRRGRTPGAAILRRAACSRTPVVAFPIAVPKVPQRMYSLDHRQGSMTSIRAPGCGPARQNRMHTLVPRN